MFSLAPRIGLAFALLFSFAASSVASETSSSETGQSVGYLNAYFAGEDVTDFLNRLAEDPQTPDHFSRTSVPAALGKAYEAFLPRLLEAIESDHASVIPLRAQYEALKADHLLFVQYLGSVDRTAEQLGSRQNLFSERYIAASNPLFESLDVFFQEIAAMDQQSVAANLASIASNIFEIRSARATASDILELVGSPYQPIIRASGLPYDSLNLAAQSPQYEPAIQPSYAQSNAPVPTADDLASTQQAPLSDPILQLAQDLGYDPARIFHYVHSEIGREWYAGAMKGALGVLEQKAANSVDQASLLIALLRASSVPARYVHGVVELSVPDLGEELGITEPSNVVQAIRSAGVPVKTIIRGGRIAAVEVQHTWVSAYVPYSNYRGATVDRSGKLWLPLDPSQKKYNGAQSSAILAKIPDQVSELSQAYLEEPQSEAPLKALRALVEQRISAEGLGDYASHLGERNIAAETSTYLPNSLRTPVIAVIAEESKLGDELVQKVRFRLHKTTDSASGVVLDKTMPVSALAGQRVTLSYLPASSDDHSLVNSFGGLDSVPPYLVNLRAQVKVAGKPVSVSSEGVAMARWQRLSVSLISPGHTETVSKEVLSGGYEAIGVSAQSIKNTEESVLPGDTEQLAARLLSQAALRYLKEWDTAEEELAALSGLAVIRPLPSLVFVGQNLKVDRVMGEPQLVEWNGVTMDAAIRLTDVVPQSNRNLPVQQFFQLSGLQGSFLEHARFESDFDVDSISADKALAIANQAGIDVRVFGEGDSALIDSLPFSEVVLDDMKGWVELGYQVKTPVSTVNYLDWSGAAWIVTNPQSGAQGYFLSGGIAGGQSATLEWPESIRNLFENEYSEPAVNNPSLVAELKKVAVTDQQKGIVGTEGEPIAVQALTADGRPVVGVKVVFSRELGGLSFGAEALDTIEAETNGQGIATAPFTHGTDTSVSSLFLRLSASQRFSDQVSYNTVNAVANPQGNRVRLQSPFEITTFPGQVTELKLFNDSIDPEPGSWVTTLRVKPVDEYLNPVANVDVTVSVGAPTPPLHNGGINAKVANTADRVDCPRMISVFDCGSSSALEATSPTYGALFYLLNGNESDLTYRWTVSAAGITESLTSTVGSASSRVKISYGRMIASNGSTATAAKVGTEYPAEMVFTAYRNVEVAAFEEGNKTYRQYERVPVNFAGLPSLEVTQGGEASGSAYGFRSLGDNDFGYRVKVGLEPGYYQVNLDGVEASTGATVTGRVGVIYGLQPEIISHAPEQGLLLNESETTSSELVFAHQTQPANYSSPERRVYVFENEQLVFNTTTEKRTSVESPWIAKLPSGISIDPNNRYTAKLIFNRGTGLDIASEPYPLPISQNTIRYPGDGALIRASRQIDLMNQWICDYDSKFQFGLNHAAKVTIELEHRRTKGQITLATEEDFAEGAHELDLPVGDLTEGFYDFKITTVSSLDDHVEEKTGYVEVQYNLEANLPVGHAIEENVDLFDGHLVLSRTDLSIQSRGPDLEFKRFYSSNSRDSGVMGAGWSHNLDSQVKDIGCGAVAITGGAGGGRFFPDGEGGYRPEKGRHGHLEKLEDQNGWKFTAKDGTQYQFERFSFNDQRSWQLGFVMGTNGNLMALGYDPAATEPLLQVVEDEAGRKLQFEYEATQNEVEDGRRKVISKVTAPFGIELLFTYDEQGRLLSATKQGADGTAVTESYSYNGLSPLAEEYQRFNDLLGVTDANGNETTYTYEMNRFLSNRVDPDSAPVDVSSVSKIVHSQPVSGDEVIDFTYSARDSLVGDLTAKVERGNGRVRDWTLNEYGAPIEQVSPAGTVTMTWTPDDVLMTSRTDERGVTTDYEHDQWGNVTSEKTGNLPGITRQYATIGNTRIRNRVASETGRNGETTEYFYDGSGNLTSISHPEGLEESYTYAENGDRLTHIDRNGNVTAFQDYDSYGYVTSVANVLYCCDETTWNELGLKTSITNGRGAKTDYRYDGIGRLVEIKDAEGGTRTISYDGNGNKTQETDEEGRSTGWEYNAKDQITLTEKTLAGGTINSIREYDAYGNLLRQSDWLPDADKHWTRHQYDAANRQTDTYREVAAGQERHTRREFDGVGNVTRQEQDLGRFQRFEYDDLGRQIRVYDAFDELTRETVYDDLAKTRTVYDKLRREVVTQYDGLGRAIRVTQQLASGKTKETSRTFDGNGNVLEEINPIGRRTETEYDALDRPVKQSVFGNGGDILSRTTSTYDDAGNLTRSVNGRRVPTVYTYDLLNRKISEEFPKDSGKIYNYSYDKVGNRTQEVWPNGNIVDLVYDDLNRLDTRTDRLGLLEDNDYDANGNVVRKTDASGNETTSEYNGANELVVRHLPENRKDVRTYDLVGNLLSESRQTEGGGRVSTTTYTYDLLNRKVTETDQSGFTATYEYDKVDNLTSVTNRRDHKTTYTYNDLNQRTSTVDPNSDTLQFSYDLVGNLVSSTDKKGNVTNQTFDALNRVTQVERNTVLISTKEYDEVGNLVTETDANGNVTVRVYDGSNQLIELSREESSLTRYAYDDMGNRTAECDPESRATNWRYDYRGRQIFAINNLGEATTYNYDGNGNRIAQTKPKGNSVESVNCSYADTEVFAYPGDSADYTWTYDYDAADRLISVTDGDGEATTYTYNFLDLRTGHTDALDQSTAMTYNNFGQLITVTYADGEQENYTSYDGNGNLTAMTDARGNQVTYVYDVLDRETQRSFTPIAPLADEVVQVDTTYDKNGNVTSISETDNVGDTRVTTQSHDSFDRLVRREDSYGKATNYAYDDNGNRTQLIDPDQNVTKYTFDKLNRVSTVTNLQGTTAYSYDKSGLRKKVEYPSNATMGYGYDPVGRTASITHTQNSAQVSAYEYEYDAHGNRTRQEETNGRGLEVTTYAYDNLDRLTEVTYPDVPVGTGTTVLYTYDAAYNRTGETTLNIQATTIADKTYQYNDRNQLTDMVDNLEATQSVNYTFDANGNQTAKTKAGTTTSFVYDVRDNLRSVTTGGSTVGQFLYDYRGLRIEKDGARGIERYSYDDQSVLTQFDETGATLAKFEYGGQRLISLNSLENGLQFYHFDALGSPVTLTKPNGTVQARYSYDAWGHRRYQNGESWNRFGFTGHEHDEETNLIYAKARYYDPDTGRFLSQDPWEGDTTIAPSLNKYLYAYQNPTVYWDPDGREAYPLFNVPVNEETDLVTPFTRIDTGNVVADHVLAFAASVPNFGYMAVNGFSNGVSLPMQAYAGVRGKTLDEADAEVTGLIASTGPAAPYLLAGSAPFRTPLALSKLRRGVNALDESSSIKQTSTVVEGTSGPGTVEVISDPSRLLPNPARNYKTGELDPNYQPPEIAGEAIQSYPAPEGLRVEMAIDQSYQVDPVSGLVQNPGSFTTRNHIESVEQVRSDLAVKTEFKGNITHVQEFEIQPGTRVQESTVGPQRGSDGEVYPGGGNQIQILPQPRKKAADFLIPMGNPRSIE